MALKNLSPTKTSSWKELKVHYEKMKNSSLKYLFERDPHRDRKFSILSPEEDFLVDFSKNHIDSKTLELLINLAKECNLEASIEKMFAGKPINLTEKRAVLHTALRNPSTYPTYLDEENITKKITKVLSQMKNFSEKILTGTHKGYSKKPITDVVNIGIGGSDLGSLMVTEALKEYKTPLNIYFVSNIDGAHIFETLKNLHPETTLFIIASKTFTTQETMSNAAIAKEWFLNEAKNEAFISKHFVALSTNREKVKEFGILTENQFEFWDWVGGRYSLWGAIGLPICLGIGYKNFEKLLEGAHQMDEHFKNATFEKNIPVLLALIGIWYRNFFGASTYGIFPYSQYLHKFPAYLQQLDMESNGKSTDREGNKIEDYATGPIIWGEVGTNGQHSFYQLLHQGTELIPCDFIAFSKDLSPHSEHHIKLLSHFFAQTRGLAFGKTAHEVIDQLKKQNKSPEEISILASFKTFEGNRPSNSILIKELSPETLGKLIAIYEHKVFTQGIIWNIFSFDQWGVELGKELSSVILEELKSNKKIYDLDSSTNKLISFYKRHTFK